MKLRHWAVVGLVTGTVCGIALAFAANNYRQPTSGGTVTTFKSTDNAGVHTPHVNVDTAAASASQYPAGSTPITITNTGTTGATAATLAGVALKTTYLCGFSVRSNATAAATGNITVAGTITGTLNFTHWAAPLASGIGVTEPPIGSTCIPASAVNTGIVITGPAPGAGGTISVSGWGYQL